jgi:hypothetical protein
MNQTGKDSSFPLRPCEIRQMRRMTGEAGFKSGTSPMKFLPLLRFLVKD